MILNLKIRGARNNNLSIIIENECVGKFDADHNSVEIGFTEREFKERFNATANDIQISLSDYYDELKINEYGEVVGFEIEYKIQFEEEEEEI